MFIVSGPEMILAQCKAGIVSALPALNARPESILDEWLSRITYVFVANCGATGSRRVLRQPPVSLSRSLHLRTSHQTLGTSKLSR